MSNKYTEKEIEWAINELKKKHPERATHEQAISLLNTLKGLPKIVVEKIKKDKKAQYQELIDLLNEWDPLNVSSETVKDEYDCFLGPILNTLQKNPSKEELVDVINKHLEEHVGVEAKNYDTEKFANKVLTWWRLK